MQGVIRADTTLRYSTKEKTGYGECFSLLALASWGPVHSGGDDGQTSAGGGAQSLPRT